MRAKVGVGCSGETRHLAHIRHTRVSHAYGFPRYARSGWWAGVPHWKAAL
jgi:hypothetical protein